MGDNLLKQFYIVKLKYCSMGIFILMFSFGVVLINSSVYFVAFINELSFKQTKKFSNDYCVLLLSVKINIQH